MTDPKSEDFANRISRKATQEAVALHATCGLALTEIQRGIFLTMLEQAFIAGATESIRDQLAETKRQVG